MKTDDEVMARIRALLLVEFDRRIEHAQRRLPNRCVHNHRQELDPRKAVEDEPNLSYNRVDRRRLPVVNTMGLCMLGAENPEEWPGNICEDPIDAQRCPYFDPLQTKDALLAEFQEQLKDYQWVEENLPDVYALLWVLSDIFANFHLPWWKRVLFWFLKIRVEPVRSGPDMMHLLPPGDADVQGP
jgi:hypothetical protein